MVKQQAKQQKEEAEISLDSIKKNLHWIALALILIFGFYLRIYHLDYPVVGYHNWKETHYLTEARNFERYGDWLTPRSDFPDLGTNPEGAHGDTMPWASWFSALGFMVFGEKVWIARLLSVIFMMGSIFLFYLIMKKLFKREDLALVTALVASTNPLFVFFGRQVQLNNYAIFFSMLSLYLYLLWLEKPEEKSSIRLIFLASLFFIIAFMTEYTHALFAIPMLAIFPFSKLKEKVYLGKNWKTYLYAALPAILIFLWYLNNKRIASQYLLSAEAQKALQGDVYYNLSTLFTSNFWSIMKPFAADNYTLIGVFFACIGLILFVFKYRKTQGDRFLLAYILGSIPWVWIMASKLSGHSYHQYPIAPLFIILIAYCFVVISGTIESLIKIKYSRWLIIAGLFLLLVYPPIFKFGGGIFEAKDRQFDTQFYGLDIAGDYLKKNSAPDERLFFSGHQSFGVIWEADRKGTAGRYGEWHYNESVTRMAEDKYNFRWILVYQWGLEVIQKYPDRWAYITNNYSLKQVAFQQTQQGNQVLYMLFEKGGSFNQTALNGMLQQKQQTGQYSTKDYELTQGKVQIVYFDV